MALDYAILAKAQDVNFVAKFDSDLHNLLDVLSVSDITTLQPGQVLKTYKTSGTLGAGTAEENAVIPNSNIKVDDATVKELKLKKYRNLVSIEAINKKGYDLAVGGANERLLREIQAVVHTSIFTGLKDPSAGTAEAAGFQAKIAAAAAYLKKKFANEACTPIIFVSVDEAYEYLGAHNVTLESSYGLSYLQNFMGIGTVIIDANIPTGEVYATASENLEVVSAAVASIPGFDLTTDETGMIGVHTDPAYSTGSVETVAFCGVEVFPVYADRVVKVTNAG